jgi:rod shape-determining protein MreC
VAVYTVNRRRAIVLLILSSILLLTLDLRGNPLIDRMRSAFDRVLSPFVTAGNVIATPIKNLWYGATTIDQLEKENAALRDQIAAQRGDDVAARAFYGDYQDLVTLNGLTARYPTVTARVVGGAPGNFEQTIEIDRGSEDAIKVGMAVINAAGLVGKITKVYDNRSVVLLVTDSAYAIECKVSGLNTVGPDGNGVGGTPIPGIEASSTTADTTPSGIPVDYLNTTTTLPPTTTTEPTTTLFPPDSAELAALEATSTSATTSVESTTTVAPTTTVVPLLVTRETGGCLGRGVGKLPAMQYITENPAFGPIDVGDIVTTTGGSTSLAPPDLPIGEVVNKVTRAGSAGPLLEIKLAADLAHLNFVQVVRYVPPSEVPSG